MRHLLVCLFVFGLAASAMGRDIFVDNRNGDDRRNGSAPTPVGTVSGPVRTIAKAIRLCHGTGERIILINTGEPYREEVSVQGPGCSGTDVRPFEIIGNGAVLDGRATLVGGPWEHHRGDVFRIQPKFMSYQQVFLGDQLAVRRQPVDGLPPDLKPLEWCLLNGYIYFRVEPGKLPDSYDISCCGLKTGITLYNVHDVVISDLTIRGFHLDGLNAHDNVRGTDVSGVTSIENGRSGFSIGGASRVRLENCTAAGNGAAQVRVEGFSITHLLENMLDGASAPTLVQEGGRVIVD